MDEYLTANQSQKLQRVLVSRLTKQVKTVNGLSNNNYLSMFLNAEKEPEGSENSNMVNLVQSNWNILVEDFYRVRGIITVLYPTNYIPGLSRTNTYNPEH